MSETDSVIIVGAGVAGLCCAIDLKRHGIPVQILERSDAVGGRVRTDVVEGFRLDRGFQVWLEAYPECKKRLSPEILKPGAFASGAVLFDGYQLRRFPDPLRHPKLLFEAASHPVGSLKDKLLLQKLRSGLSKTQADELFNGTEMSALERWREVGISQRMIDGFLTPFFRGIFLADPDQVSRRMFDFVYAMFGKGRALLPNLGMGAIPEFLASELDEGDVHFSVEVARVHADRVMTVEGEEIRGRAVVLAVEDPVALGFQLEAAPVETRAVTCLYFDASVSPVDGPWLVLNGSGTGRVNQVSVNSMVVDGLAPDGRHLIAVSVNGMAEEEPISLVRVVTDELQQWFGTQVEGWRFLKEYRIDHALPAFAPGQLLGPGVVEEQGVVCCGDSLAHPSLQGAMESGAKAAQQVATRLRP